MDKKLFFLIAGLCSCLFCGCHDESKNNVFYDWEYLSIKEKSISEKRIFCIVLVDSAFDVSKYLEKMKRTDFFPSFTWYIVNTDVKENNWYKYLLGSSKSPFTLQFDTCGNLRNITYGISRFSLQSLDESLTSSDKDVVVYRNFGFLENSAIHANSSDVHLQINHLLKLKDFLSDSTGCNIDTDTIMKDMTLAYPYSEYLKIQCDKRFHRNDSAILRGKEFLEHYGNASYGNTYGSLLAEVRHLVEELTFVGGMVATADSETYCCTLGDTLNIQIRLTNQTHSPVEISSIEPSCHCIQISGFPKEQILPGESKIYDFFFIPDSEGHFYREIYFHSNGDLPVTIASFQIVVNPIKRFVK